MVRRICEVPRRKFTSVLRILHITKYTKVFFILKSLLKNLNPIQSNVKGMYKERVMNVCLHFTCRTKAKYRLLIIPRTLYGILKKTNKGLSWIKWQSNSSFVRKKYPFSEADSNLIRTRLEQMSQKWQKTDEINTNEK